MTIRCACSHPLEVTDVIFECSFFSIYLLEVAALCTQVLEVTVILRHSNSVNLKHMFTRVQTPTA